MSLLESLRNFRYTTHLYNMQSTRTTKKTELNIFLPYSANMYTVYIDMFRLYWSITSSQSLIHIHRWANVRIVFTLISLCWEQAEILVTFYYFTCLLGVVIYIYSFDCSASFHTRLHFLLISHRFNCYSLSALSAHRH